MVDRYLPLLVVLIWTLALGSIVGSYLNVVVYRLPRGLSTIRPRSACPSCGLQVAAYDNIPVLSYLLLRGRCRHCRAPISPRYPLVEATSAGLFLLCLFRFGFSTEAMFAAVLVCLLLALALIDLEHFLLPNALTYPGIALGLISSLWVSRVTPLAALLGGLTGGLGLLSVVVLWSSLRSQNSFGFGDVKMLAMIGTFLGVRGVIEGLLLASLAAVATGLAGALRKRRLDLDSRLPFGVFLALGAAATLFFGGERISWSMPLLGQPL